MKKRRFAVVAFLLCACLIVGIGFAVTTYQLEIGGTIYVNMDDTDFVVQFKEIKAVDASDDVDVANVEASCSGTSATVTLPSGKAFSAAGQWIKFEAIVENDSTQYDASLKEAVITNPSGFLKILPNETSIDAVDSVSVPTNRLDVTDNNEKTGPDSTTITFVVYVDNLPTGSRECTFNIKVQADAVSNND